MGICSFSRSRVAYFIIFTVHFILICLSRCLQSEILFLSSLSTFSHCNDPGRNKVDCVQWTGVIRLSFGYSLGHFVMAVLLFHRKRGSPHDWQLDLQYKLWLLKIIGFLICLILSFFVIPINFYSIYWYIGTMGGGIFLFIQVVLLVDFGYTWHESWAESYAVKCIPSHMNPLPILATLVFYLISAVAAVGLYFTFAKDNYSNCITNVVIIIEVVVMCIVFSIISATYKIERGSIFISSILTLYLIMLIWSALASSDKCLSKKMESISYISVIVVSSIFTVFSIGYSSLYYFVAPRKIQEETGNGTEDTNDTQSSVASDNFSNYTTTIRSDTFSSYGTLVRSEHSMGPSKRRESIIESLRVNLIGNKRSYNFTKFHLVFCFGGMYLCMVLTSWGNNKVLVFWIEVGVQVITVVLYIWSLIAPLFIKDLQLPSEDARRIVIDNGNNEAVN